MKYIPFVQFGTRVFTQGDGAAREEGSFSASLFRRLLTQYFRFLGTFGFIRILRICEETLAEKETRWSEKHVHQHQKCVFTLKVYTF